MMHLEFNAMPQKKKKKKKMKVWKKITLKDTKSTIKAPFVIIVWTTIFSVKKYYTYFHTFFTHMYFQKI